MTVTRFIRYAAAMKTGKSVLLVATFIADGGDEKKQGKKKKKKKKAMLNLKRTPQRASMYEGDVVLEGELQKQTSGSLRRWVTRYFTIRGHYLKYYQDEEKESVKGVFDLSQVSECRVEIVTWALRKLTLESPTAKPLLLRGPNASRRAPRW